VIGGGVVGLAVARTLALRGASTVLLERHATTGTETSSRNSEVIHAGLYYPRDSLKTRLCISGKAMLYAVCAKENIPHENVGKWVVAQTATQMEELEKLARHASSLGVPLRWIAAEEAKRREPDVRADAGVLESPTTGIVDAHSVMGYLQEDFSGQGGDVALRTTVTGLERDGAQYVVHTSTQVGDATEVESTTIRADTVINCAGLAAVRVSNMLLPKERHRKAYFAKGNYFSYSAPRPKPSTLVYPAPEPGAGGLGTHLTLDLAGGVRFGPDIEWIEDPEAEDVYRPNEERLNAALDAIEQYLPTIQRERVQVDYCGIRPKLKPQGAVGQGKGFQDFVIQEEEGYLGFVNLLGIESPGLTSSLAIAEEVERILYK
jgi:2-hydroxyglutarate dehydrogenase